MFEIIVCAPRIQLYVTDTSRAVDKKSFKKTQQYLQRAVAALELWMWQKGKKGLGLPSRIRSVECQLQICGVSKIKKLNHEYRGKNKKTDVLSFQMLEGLRSGDCELMTGVLNLGDLFICREVALQQSRTFKLSYEEEVVHLFIHGWLHLCGFDHEISEAEEQVMEFHEKLLLDSMAKQKGKIS